MSREKYIVNLIMKRAELYTLQKIVHNLSIIMALDYGFNNPIKCHAINTISFDDDFMTLIAKLLFVLQAPFSFLGLAPYGITGRAAGWSMGFDYLKLFSD